MSFVAVAVGVAGLAGAAISAGAAGQAADQQAAAAQNAQNISQHEFETITGQETPFMQSGYGGLGQLNYLLGIGTPGTEATTNWKNGMPVGTAPTAASSTAGGYGSLLTPFSADMMKQYSPAYQFQLQQGGQGVLNQDTASQGALSGAALKDLISFNQGTANTAFNNAFNQYQTQQGNIYSRLANLANLGQNAAANTGQQGTALAGQAAQSAQNIGTAQAAGTVGAANAWSSGLSNAATPWLLANQNQNPFASGSYNSVMNNGGFGSPDSYGSGYTLEDYGAQP